MCGISGFFQQKQNFLQKEAFYRQILDSMNLALRRLSIVDLVTGHQPMLKKKEGRTWGIIYNGELYNTEELRRELKTLGHDFCTTSDTEVILCAYMEYGPDFVKRLNGIFAIAIMDPIKDRLVLYLTQAYGKWEGTGEYVLQKTQAQLAQRIGMNVRTVQRSIRKLEEEGFLSCRGSKLCISQEQYEKLKAYRETDLIH